MLDAHAPGLWTVSAPLKLAGAKMGTRMTVARLAEDGLALIAPVPIDGALAEAIGREGTVRAVIAPNAFHHFYLVDAVARYPEAACFMAEGVAAKLKSLPPHAKSIPPQPDPVYADALDQQALEGVPTTNEVVFFHASSKTLILTDLCFHFDPPPGGWTGFFLRLAGAHAGLAMSRLMRSLIKDREALRASVARILDWDFERIVVTHGQVVSQDARAKFEGAMDVL